MQGTILITGATGFIGSFIAAEALEQGLDVWAAVRKTSSTRYLQDKRIHTIELTLGNGEKLMEQLRGHHFDYVVHAAGVTKCLNKQQFFDVNTQGTVNLATAITRLAMPVRRFVYISSLSVMGPAREQMPYSDILATDTPCPNTAYGQSKLESERLLAKIEGLPVVTLRPTGVYGPREKDYFMMAKSIAQHVDFAVGYKPQVLTFVYVKDVVQAVMAALTKGQPGQSYFLSDGCNYSSRAFSDLIQQELGVRWLLRIKAPLWVLRAITLCGEYAGRLSGKVTALNNDKYHIMCQRNWMCDITPARRDLGYNPQYNLKRGVKETISWYKKEGWI